VSSFVHTSEVPCKAASELVGWLPTGCHPDMQMSTPLYLSSLSVAPFLLASVMWCIYCLVVAAAAAELRAMRLLLDVWCK